VKNFGTLNLGAFKVFFQIDTVLGKPRLYKDSALIPSLSVGDSTTATALTAWAKPHAVGSYTVTCSTKVQYDTTTSNDRLRGPFTVTSGPPGWTSKSPMPITPSGKYLQAGGFLTYNLGNNRIYGAKGNKTGDFYAYHIVGDSWHQLTTWPTGLEGKLPKAGAVGACDGNGLVYATKGNNTQGFWLYNATKDSWYQKANVPLGPTNKKVKGGTDAAYVVKGSDKFVYLLKGYKNEFWKYFIAGDSWHQLQDAPIGANMKWDKGSFVAYDDVNKRVYAHKAKYHEFYYYDVTKDSWSATTLKAMPLTSYLGTSKKSKEGGAGAYLTGKVYAFKGGNTTEFWRYYVQGDSWQELDTIPSVSGGKKKKVKGGADVVAAGLVLYATKGNKVNDFYRYSPPGFFALPRPERYGVMASQFEMFEQGMVLSPNPLANGFATLRYGLPRAGAAQVRVFDVTGRTVMQKTLNLARSGVATLDLRHLSAGVYLVKFSAEDFAGTQKLVVQR
jgi:hypothetical protein